MTEALILLGSVPSEPGKVLRIQADVTIHKGVSQDTILCDVFPPDFVPIAEAALKLAKFELLKLGYLSDSALQVLLLNDSQVHWNEFESAMLPVALLICVAVYQEKFEKDLPYRFAATGKLSNRIEVKPVELLSAKLKAAIDELGEGDKIFIPKENFSNDLDELSLAKAKGIKIIPIKTLGKGITELLEKIPKTEDPEPGLIERWLKKTKLLTIFLISVLTAIFLEIFVTNWFSEGCSGPNGEPGPKPNQPPPIVILKLRSDLPTNIFVDGKLLESNTKGPVEVDVSVDSHKISFENTEFNTAFSIFASPQKRSEFICRYLTSINITSKLEESGDYKGALVLVNDYHFQNKYTPTTIQLKPGSYKISLGKLGYAVSEEDSLHLVPKLNQNTKKLNFTLRER